MNQLMKFSLLLIFMLAMTGCSRKPEYVPFTSDEYDVLKITIDSCTRHDPTFDNFKNQIEYSLICETTVKWDSFDESKEVKDGRVAIDLRQNIPRMGGCRSACPEFHWDELSESFSHNNERVYSLNPDSLRSLYPCNIFTDSLYNACFKINHDPDRGWEVLYKQYRHCFGLIRLSRAAFNNQGNEAIVYYEYGSNSGAGHGAYNLFVKRNGKWSFYKRIETFIV